MKKCSACEEVQEANAIFCTNCGQRLAEDSNVKKCPSCGTSNKPEDAFCSDCGSRLEGPKAQASESSPVATQLLALNNEFLSVRESSAGQFEFSSETGARSAVQHVKIKYTALAILDPLTKQITFWEKMVESSAGMTAGVFAEKTVQKGIDVGKKIHGQLLFGGKYGFEYGKLKDVVKDIAAKHGWNFKLNIFKPKSKTETTGLINKIPFIKVLGPIFAILLIMAIGLIAYFTLSSDSSKTTSQAALESHDSGKAGKAGSIIFGKSKTEADSSKQIIQTDRDTYRSGEKIQVHYYNAPGHSRDWICIVPVGSRNTDAGDYQYIPRRGQGVLTFRSPGPGRYEARAFYRYSPGRYRITARYTFTVEG